MSIAENIAEVRARVDAAAQRASRSPGSVTLMAVTKTFPAAAIHEAYAAGLRVFGENRVQEFAGKRPEVADLGDDHPNTPKPGVSGTPAEFHLIGHLQSNKATRAAELFRCIDTVDSLRLAQRLNEAAGQLGKRLRVLIEINIGGEEQKSGLAPDSVALEELLAAVPVLRCLEFRGLMTVPPFTEDPESARPFFRRLRELRDQLASRSLPSLGLDVLSMGMSHDFEVAIEEGSTCVRVGTAIFGTRPRP